MPENASFYVSFAEVSFLTRQKETSCHVFKMSIFSKFFGYFARIRSNISKKIDQKFSLIKFLRILLCCLNAFSL